MTILTPRQRVLSLWPNATCTPARSYHRFKVTITRGHHAYGYTRAEAWYNAAERVANDKTLRAGATPKGNP